MPDYSAEIGRVLAERDGVDPQGDIGVMTRALMERFPGVTSEMILRGWEIAREILATDAKMAPSVRKVPVVFGEPTLAWRCTELDRLWLSSNGRAYFVRPALENETWTLGKSLPAGMTALAIVRGTDGATLAFACRDPSALTEASDDALAGVFDDEIDAAIGRTARGPQ